MKTISFNYNGNLPDGLNNIRGNILVQIYDAKHNKELTSDLVKRLKEVLKNPIIIGKSTTKPIQGGLSSEDLVCIITSFKETEVKVVKIGLEDNFKNGIYSILEKNTKALFLLSNAKLDFDQVVEDLKIFKAYQFFGNFGSASDYLIYDDNILDEGLIALSLNGEIEIHTKNILNFVGYGEYDHVTKVEGTRIYEINHKKVTDYFKDIFDIDDSVLKDVIYKFPLLTSKDEYNPLKILKVYEDGSIEIPRSLNEMDHIRLAIANFEFFEEDLIKTLKEFSKYNIESIFIYSTIPATENIKDLNFDDLAKIDDVVPLNGDTGVVSVTKFYDVPSLSTGGVTIVSMAEDVAEVELSYHPLSCKKYYNLDEKLGIKLLTELAKKYDVLANYVNNITNDLAHEYDISPKDLDLDLNLPNYQKLVKDLFGHEEEYNISVCDFTNEYLLRDFYGDDFINECKKELVSQILREYDGNFTLYAINQGFASISTISEKEHIKMMNEVYKKMFKYGFAYKGELIDFGFVYSTVYKGTKNALIKVKRALYETLEKGYVTKDYRDTFSSAFELKEGIDHYSLVQNAYKNHGFKVYYQGIYNVRQKRINHFEALIRIEDNRTGKVYSPGAFIETAYKFGYSRYITMMVMEQAFEEVSKHVCAISVNLRLTDIEDNDVYYLLLELLDKYNCQNKVMLEILEDINIIKNQTSLERLRNLREMGIKIAIDDFGAGYSNFDYLKPDLFDYLKISGELTKNLTPENDVMIEMVKSVVHTGHRLGMKVVVEYCEDEETADLLTELGADFIQGYYFAKPTEKIELN